MSRCVIFALCVFVVSCGSEPAREVQGREPRQLIMESSTVESVAPNRVRVSSKGEIKAISAYAAGYGHVAAVDLFADQWDLLKLSQNEAEATALHRICAREVSWNSLQDCLGFYQVVESTRSRRCDNTRIASVPMGRRISQCRDKSTGEVFSVSPNTRRDNAEETMLSAFRRHSARSVGALPPKWPSRRWVQELSLDCQKPRSWPRRWPWNDHVIDKCKASAKQATRLAADGGRLFAGVLPRAWGGRCENEGGACDDHIACSRGMARIPSDTLNAFWCNVGEKGCSATIDPVCMDLPKKDVEHDEAEEKDAKAQVDSADPQV